MKTITVTMKDGTSYEVQRLLTHERSNAKLRKSSETEWILFGLSLAPAKLSGHNVCSSSSAGCRAACIFTSGNGGYPSVSRGRLARTLAWIQKPEEFKAKVLEELGNAVKLAKKKGKQLAIRMNVFSDIMWEREFPELFKSFPDVRVYDYTKHYLRMMRFCRGELPKSLYLTFSRSENNEAKCLDVLKAGRNVSIPFTLNQVMHPENNVPLPESFCGFPVVNGDDNDLRFLDQQGVVVGIKTKGMGFWDKSGFIVNLMGTA